MAQHILRKELKKDAVRDRFMQGVESVQSHQQIVWLLGAVAVIVALAVFGWSSYTRRQTAQASAALDDAMLVFQARVRAPNEAAQPGELTYVDEKNKYADSEKKFAAVADKYGRTQPGRLARYYAALSEEQLKKYSDAEKNLSAIVSGGDENLAGLAQFKLAQIYDEDGKGMQAVDLYKQLEAKPTIFVPKGTVMLALADHYSKSDPAQATQLYNQVKQEYPDSPAAQQADQGLELLNSKT